MRCYQKNKLCLYTAITLLIISLFLLVACDEQSRNNPYPKDEKTKNILYSYFSERPKTLDPARSYSSNEYLFIGQIYQPPLQYHYLKRPYELIVQTATQMPAVQYLDKNKQFLPKDAATDLIAYTTYTIHIKPGIKYQPHPAFAKDKQGNYLYHQLAEDFLDQNDIHRLADFATVGSRELTAADYVYQIKRLGHPELQSPIFGLMSSYILGLKDYPETLKTDYQKLIKTDGQHAFIDLRSYPLEGVKLIDQYTYQITINGQYPQFMYWLAMPFFSPVPWEADIFDSQPDMDDRNITLDWYPVGTGPYMLTENNPNREMVLDRNPYFQGESYPQEGAPGDKALNLLADAGEPLPFVDRIVFSLEKESIPLWNKFLQGYYDTSGISSDSFDQAIQITADGEVELSSLMKEKNLHLYQSVDPSIYYMGFNMLDDVVGGYSERAQKLRQAISIIINYEEFISIFANGRGISAQGPIPPGIFGFQAGKQGINPYVYQITNGHVQRKTLNKAKQLLVEAGYPNGRDSQSQEPLILNYDVPASSGPDDKARFDWMRKQFAKLGIQLNIRATQYNRFQQKMRTGDAQIFTWGWHADYPDPENFLFLLYGPNGKVKHGGENAANYSNPVFDTLFIKMKGLPNTDERKKIIEQMLAIIRKDAPWIWGYHPKIFTLSHQWNRVTKTHPIAKNTLKYARLDPIVRHNKRQEWNVPIYWPIFLILLLLLVSIIPIVIRYWRKVRQ